MNAIKIESVLRSRTLEMFSDKWYKTTSKNIIELFNDKKESEIDEEKINLFNWFSENLIYGELYDSKKVYLQLNLNISKKKMTMLLQEYCKIYKLNYKSVRTHAKRNFILEFIKIN